MNYEMQSIKQKPTLFVIDDTPDNLALISELLKNIYHVKVATSGEKALDYFEKQELPDLILLDIMMPGLSGYDVLKHLKSKPKTRDIPVIFLTAMSTVEDEKKGLEMGAVDYITRHLAKLICIPQQNHGQS